MDIEPDNLLQADTEATEQLSIKKQLDQGARALAFVWILVILLVTLFMVTHEPRSFYGQDGWPLPCPPPMVGDWPDCHDPPRQAFSRSQGTGDSPATDF
ncbi:MAG TPA: hypothetical protein VKY85_16150 [Candidatus Angelobacter sp.]|nr:hypothetical protein [Candidatus Angelobacter sp.]